MTKARSNATANAAKGDLTVGNGTNLSGVLAVGNSGEQIVADSSTSTGLRYNPTMAAGKNALINGAFDIWQRGTTFTNPGGGSGTYTADRWTVYFNGNGTVTQETSVKPDTSTYSCKVTATASSADNSVYQLIEQLNMEQFRGKVVTLSVKVAGTATLAPGIGLAYSTTANDTLINTSTAITATIVANPTINASTFVTYISQFTVPTTAKTLRIQLGSTTMANTNVLYWAEAQLEIGSTATAFSCAGGTIQGELAACQRYYWKLADGSVAANHNIMNAIAFSTSDCRGVVQFPVTMRVAPTLVQTTGSSYYAFQAATGDGFDSFLTSMPAPNNVLLYAGSGQGVGSIVAGQAGLIFTDNASARVAFSAEL